MLKQITINMLYALDSPSFKKHLAILPACLSEPDELTKPSIPCPGTAVVLSVKSQLYNGQYAAILRSPEHPGERVAVYVGKHGVAISVRLAALRQVDTTGCWWTWRYMDNFPNAFEVAVVNSPRVLRGLAAIGLPAPEMVVVEAGDGAIALRCHNNVRTEVLLNGGQIVCGYSLLPSRYCQCVTFEAHSVIYRDGRLVDVTPDWQGERAKFFVREPAFMFEEYFDMVSIWDSPTKSLRLSPSYVMAKRQIFWAVALRAVLATRAAKPSLTSSSIDRKCFRCWRSRPSSKR